MGSSRKEEPSVGMWHPPGWVVVVAGRGVLVMVLVVVGAGVVVVFAVVGLAVVTRCGRPYAGKQREEAGGAYWGGRGGFPASPGGCWG